MKYKYLGLFLLFLLLVSSQAALAIGGVGIAYDVQVKEPGVKNGHLISFIQGEYRLATKDAIDNIVGVVVDQPSIVVKKPLLEHTFPIISTGEATVLINNQNGEVKVGDSLTISDKAGEAMKGNNSQDSVGEVLGSVGENQALVRLNTQVKNANSQDLQNYNAEGQPSGILDTLKQVFNLSNLAAKNDPSNAFKNIVAALVIMFSVAFTFFTVGRTARKGIEAFGRNPLAAKLISLGLVFNIMIAIAILGVGLVVAVFILRM